MSVSLFGTEFALFPVAPTPWLLFLWISLWLFAITLWMITDIVAIKFASALAARRLARLSAVWEPILFAATTGDPAPILPRVTRFEREQVLNIWCRIGDYITDDSRDGLNTIACQVGLDRYALNILRPGLIALALPNQVEIVLAIQVVQRLHLMAAWDPIETLVKKGPAPLDRYAARALVALDPRRAATAIVPALERQGRWARHLVEDLIAVGVAGAIDEYANLLASVPQSAVPGIALLLERCADLDTAQAVRDRLSDPATDDPEALAALLNTLSVVGDKEDRRLVHAYVAHEQWYVRMRAAQALGRCGDRREAEVLESLLGDQNWYTRYHAARAITRVVGLGPGHLATIMQTSLDAFARDMAAHVLAEAEAPAVRS